MCTILLLEDDYPNRFAITRYLRLKGYTVIEAECGFEALHILEHQSIDLLLADIRLPDVSGVDLVRRIRASDKSFRGIPIIAQTALAMESERRVILEAGVDYYLSKPFPLKALLELFDRISYEAPGYEFCNSAFRDRSARA